MLPECTHTSDNKMILPSDAVNLHLPITIPIINKNLDNLEIDQIMPSIYLTNSKDPLAIIDQIRPYEFTHIINIDQHIRNYLVNQLNNNKDSYNQCSRVKTMYEFSSNYEILDLNFGEESYLTTVLPNCYKAVKFIDKALQSGGTILVMDQNNNQKCLTIVIGYLMYKNNINYDDAFKILKKIFGKAELEKFFVSQLYEYEPILQVQRAQARGHSCSRELRSSLLKRKKYYDDSRPCNNSHILSVNSDNYHSDNNDVPME